MILASLLFAMQDAVAPEGRTEFWTDGGTTWLPPQSSTTAHVIDNAFYFILWSSTILTIGVTIGMAWLAWKYRRKSHAEHPAPVHESKLLEISWSVIPTILVMVVFFWGFRAYVDTSLAPSDAYEIHVDGQKWFWTFEYPNGLKTQGEVVVPAGQPIKFVMTSRDVLHSFFVPAFRIKNDVVPNRYQYVWFNAPEEGVYQVLCTEYCGTAHSNMSAKIRVVGRDAFYEYLASGGGGGEDLPPAEWGEELYTARNCNTCHTIDGSSGTGPTWQGVWGQSRSFADGGNATFDESYLLESIVDPGAKIVSGFQPQMPSYEGLMSDRDIRAIGAYIRIVNGVATEADTSLAAPAGDAATDSTATDAEPETQE